MRNIPSSTTDREFHEALPNRRYRLRSPRSGELDASGALLTLDALADERHALVVLVHFRGERVERRVYRVSRAWVDANLSAPPARMLGIDPWQHRTDGDAIAVLLAHVPLDVTAGIRIREAGTDQEAAA